MMDALFHIVDVEVWAQAVASGEYRAASVDVEGFMHCSFAAQVADTARRHYSGTTGLCVVELDPALIDAPIRVEDSYGSGTAFPHVYGAIPVRAAIAVHGLSAFDRGSGAASPDQ